MGKTCSMRETKNSHTQLQTETPPAGLEFMKALAHKK
jgi:hypothetical protein